jgi:hypothetical protein
MVEVCKVNGGSVSVAQDVGGVVRSCGPDGDWAAQERWGLHADLMLFSWALDQTRVAVLS